MKMNENTQLELLQLYVQISICCVLITLYYTTYGCHIGVFLNLGY